MKRFITRIVSLILLTFAIVLPLNMSDMTVHAAIATDTITIKVGYLGGPFYEKASFSWQELDDLAGGALSTHEQAYSYYNNERTAIASARGIYLSDLLNYAGIDISSISGFEFYTDDQSAGAFTAFSKKELIDNARYYYPNLSVDESGAQVGANGGDVNEGAVQVNTMLALEDNWEWQAVDTNFGGMSSNGRFHLLFGQEYPSEMRTNQAAKYVHTINVIFSGKPVIGTESNLDLKVGTDYTVTVNVTAADTALEKYIKDNLVWSSNNTDVIDVDMYGKLTVKKDGEAVITVTSGEASSSVTVKVSDGEVQTGGGTQGDGNVPADQAQSDSGTTGTQTPANTPAAPSATQGTTKPPAAQTKPQTEKPTNEVKIEKPTEEKKEEVKEEVKKEEDNQVSYSENDSGVYILSDELMKKVQNADWVNSVIDSEATSDSEDGSVMNWRTEPMADDAVQLVIPELNQPCAQVILIAVAIMLLLGLCTGSGKYYLSR